jgi:hypothetical protein
MKKRYWMLFLLSSAIFYSSSKASAQQSISSAELAPGTPVINSTHAAITASQPFVGPSPDSYQWHVSTSPGFTPAGGTAIPGATSSTVTYTPPDGRVYFFCCVGKRGAGSFVSHQNAGQLLRAPIYLVTLLDSLTASDVRTGGDRPGGGNHSLQTPAIYMGNALQAIACPRRVFVLNIAANGKGTNDFDPSGGSNWTAAQAAMDSFFSGAPPDALCVADVMGGTNDAAASHGNPMSAPEHAAHLANLCHAIVSRYSSHHLVVTLTSPPLFPVASYGAKNPAAANITPEYLSLIQSYWPTEDALINGTTILRGAIATRTFFLGFPSQLYDGVHVQDEGARSYATMRATAIASALGLLNK